MPSPRILAATAMLTLAATVAVPALAQDFRNEVGGRQGMMRVQALQMSVLGGMAQGKIAYDAEQAQIAADNLVTVTQLLQQPFWPEGSDSMSIEGTRAEPAIWDNYDDFLSSWAELGEAAVALQTAAASGQESLGPAVGAVGAACSACHDDYQTPR